jgi:hypothetical protein
MVGRKKKLLVWALVVGVSVATVWMEYFAGESIRVRPIRIRVLDAGTGRPLAGASVTYLLEASVARRRVLGLIPAPEMDAGKKIVFKRRGITDPSGEWWVEVSTHRLGSGERLRDEIVLVNLDVDASHRATKSAIEVAKWQCQFDSRLCGLSPDGADALLDLLVADRSSRREAIVNPDATHRGAVLMSVAWDAGPDATDWSVPEDRFRVKWNFGSLRRERDYVAVELEPTR